MKKLLLLLTAMLMMSSITSAATQRFEATGAFVVGENDSIASAKELSKKQALRSISEQAGVFIQSYSKTQNCVLTADEVKILASNIVRIIKCDYKQDFKDGNLKITAHVTAVVDDKNIDFAKTREIMDLKNRLEEEQLKNQDVKRMLVKHGAKDNETEGEMLTAKARIENGDNYRALVDINSSLSRHSNIVPAYMWYLRSVAHFNQGKYNESLSDIGKAIKTDGRNSQYYVQEALVRLAISTLYVGWNQPEEARNQYFLAEQKSQTALEFSSRYYPAFHCRSIAKYLNGSLRKSVNDSDNAVSHGGRGVSYVENFNDYIHARYQSRHKHLPQEKIIPMLQESVMGLLEIKTKH